jgi:hypothetical protein
MAATPAILLLHATNAALMLFWRKKTDVFYLVHAKMHVERKSARKSQQAKHRYGQ